VDKAISWADLDYLKHRQAQLLSDGEHQHLALARALILDPVLILLDEPTNHLESDSVVWIEAMLKGLHQRGTGILLSCHQDNALTKLCNQHWLLDAGLLTVQAKLYYVNWSVLVLTGP